MNITFSTSSTPKSFNHLQEQLTKNGGISGLVNQTIKQSLIRTFVFELYCVSCPTEPRYYLVEFFQDDKSQSKRANNEIEVEAIIADIFKYKEEAAKKAA
jgi:hypothetical protein